ncbi:MAG: DUF6484 domain-containing protein [Lautropia sp.]
MNNEQLEIDRVREASLAPAATVTITGELIGLSNGQPLVRHGRMTGNRAMLARTTIDLLAAHIGSTVVLLLEDGQPDRPIVIGRVRTPTEAPTAGRSVEVDVDGGHVVVSAAERLVLRCGLASITLTRAGKVLIEGRYLSSRSTGVNRINGATVQIN